MSRLRSIAEFYVRKIKEDSGADPIFTGKETVWVYNPELGIWTERKQFRKALWELGVVNSPTGLSFMVNTKRDVDEVAAYLYDNYGTNSFPFCTTGVSFSDTFIEFDNWNLVKKPNDSTNLSTFGFNFPYTTHTHTPNFDKVTSEIFKGDLDKDDKVNLYLEFLGACILGIATPFQTCVLMYGVEGQNGKSTLIELIKRIFPDQFRQAIPPSQWSKPAFIIKLMNVRMNLVGDIQHGEINESEGLKRLLGGDEITAKRLYENPIKFVSRCGHMLSCNSLPSTQDTTNAFWRRFIVLKFPNVFEGNRSAEEVLGPLEEEIPYIVSRALQQVCKLGRWRFTVPASSTLEKEEWQENVNVVKAFVLACTEPGGETASIKVYQAYRKWAAATGHSHPLTHKNFAIRLNQLKISKKRTGTGMVLGLTLLEKGLWKDYYDPSTERL